jgi:hypothetical protein
MCNAGAAGGAARERAGGDDMACSYCRAWLVSAGCAGVPCVVLSWTVVEKEENVDGAVQGFPPD